MPHYAFRSCTVKYFDDLSYMHVCVCAVLLMPAAQTFHRRSYALRDANQHIVLVHYFDEANKVSHIIASANSHSSNSRSRGTTPASFSSSLTSSQATPKANGVSTEAKGLKRALSASSTTTAALTTITPQFPLKPAATEMASEESVDVIMNSKWRAWFSLPTLWIILWIVSIYLMVPILVYLHYRLL